MSSSHDGQSSREALIEAGRQLHSDLTSLQIRLKRMRTALDGVQLSDAEREALSQGTVPAVTPDVQKFLALRGEYSEALADLESVRQRQYAMVADALGNAYPHYWSAADVDEWCHLGDKHPRLNASTIEDLIDMRQVPNAPFRKRVLEMVSASGGYTQEAIVKAIYEAFHRFEAECHLDDEGQPIKVGASKFRTERDWSAVEYILGLTAATDRAANVIFISYDQADVLRRVLKLDPHTAGV